MNKKEIIKKLENDIDYIPSKEELDFIKGSSFSCGLSPVFKIVLKVHDKNNREIIKKIEKKTKDIRPYGLFELYSELQAYGYCSSYSEARIYYVAYTLAEHIDFKIEGFEYKEKLDFKIKEINRLQGE